MKKYLLLIACNILLITTILGQWQHCNGPEGGLVSTIAIDTLTNCIYTASDGGVYVSINSGSSWKYMNDGITNIWVKALKLFKNYFLILLSISFTIAS